MRPPATLRAVLALLALVLLLGAGAAALVLTGAPTGGSPPGNGAPIDDNHPPGWRRSADSGDTGTGRSQGVSTRPEPVGSGRSTGER